MLLGSWKSPGMFLAKRVGNLFNYRGWTKSAYGQEIKLILAMLKGFFGKAEKVNKIPSIGK